MLLDCIVCGLLRGFWQASFVFLVGTRFCTTCFCRFWCFFSKEKIDVALLLFGVNVGVDFGFEMVPNGNWQFFWVVFMILLLSVWFLCPELLLSKSQFLGSGV